MRIALLVPGLHRFDAVSNDTLGMAAALRAQGHEVALFAPHADGVDEQVLAPEAIERWACAADDVIVYHYCIGWDFALDLFRRTRARRVLRYHNITPPEFFDGWSQGYVEACAGGRAQLDAYAALDCELYLGCSPYNLEDFLSRGVDPARCAVVAPFHRVEDLVATAPDPSRLPAADGAPRLLMVGRIAPNKGHLQLADALAVCLRDVDPATRLLLVGKLDPNLASYGRALQQRIAELGIGDQVTELSGASGAELRAAFATADALVMLSAHEGFCVPLVEAMALGTPVIAYGSSAIPWTLGDAGLVWDEPDPWLVAASLRQLRADPQLRQTLRERGLGRYRETFAPDALARDLATTLERFSIEASATAGRR